MKSVDLPTSKFLANWFRDGPGKLGCKATQLLQLLKFPTLPSLKTSWNASSQGSFQLQLSTTPKWAAPSSTLGIFGTRWWSIPATIPLLCITFPSNLKGVPSNWFYSLSPYSLHNFEEVIKALLTQYASRQEAKKNNHYFLSIKMRQSDSLKLYIGFFQS